jgi:hypothetical protein
MISGQSGEAFSFRHLAGSVERMMYIDLVKVDRAAMAVSLES